MNYRIVETERGFIIEKLNRALLKDFWSPHILYRGTNEAYLYDSYERAENVVMDQLRIELKAKSKIQNK